MALCRMCGETEHREAELDFGGFTLAFEQLYNQGVPLDPDALDELRLLVDSEDDEDVNLTNWHAFHRQWLDATRMESHLTALVQAKRRAEQEEARQKEFEATLRAKEEEWSQKLSKAVQDSAAKRPKPKLLADEVDQDKKRRGRYFEERESAARAAAQYRSLAPEKWAQVVADIGGLDGALEEIRRRVWTPLCAPMALLDELGAERVKGLLLYGPPGCGKSYLASRLSRGLSRRPPTIISGPEVMDKYVGSSEAALRELFTSPPRVPPRPGDAEDVMMVAEENELHVVLLDEFDAIARQRSDGRKGDTATRDSVVNQLLVLMDGVSTLPVPTFVLALTNRRELIDSAVLRPGRLEVHVEVGRPDAAGRAAILRIHAEKMRESGRLALDGVDGGVDGGMDDGECKLERVDDATYDEWVEALAARTDGFSGAAIAAVVRAAVARALDRSVSSDDVVGCQVSAADFDRAIADVRGSSMELQPVDDEEEEED